MSIETIPHMGGHTIGAELEHWAAESAGAIVEVGSWLGAGTAHLAVGARRSGQELHVYDRWQASETEVNKARWQGVNIRIKQDLLPLVMEALEPVGATVFFHKGEIASAQWPGEPIGMYVDDAAKKPKAFGHVRRTFWPHLVDGAIIVMMDYYYFEKTGDPNHRCQFEYIEARPGEFLPIARRIGESSNAVFRYRRHP